MRIDIVYFKDARKMSEIDDGSITLIVTSPPYWNIKDYSLDGFQQKRVSTNLKGQIGDIQDYKKYLSELTKVWKECERVLKPNGKICINVPIIPIPKSKKNTHYTRDIVNINSGIENEILNNTSLYLMDIFIWNRTNPTRQLMFGSYPYPPNFYVQNTVEFISVYVKDGIPEKKDKKIKEDSKLSEKEWIEYTKQIWNIPVTNVSDMAYGEHPAIMPLELAKRLIKLYSFVDDIVLDPFMGSGTTAKAAIECKRHYIGYEINPKYKSIIQRKIAQIPIFKIQTNE